ncbi:RNA polymerase II C-terminal domain phosphatase-like 1 isoform X1 [Musa acuminata AAA Group]|uniref:RNA polymerase II C-terminal domain phosphatase-like 1 isoform X1 n=1 Tax=Musa acuminata AAA Group TaxID=214697 RepID=UPI0031D2EC49
MLAEIKHSQDDKLIMKQYADSDQVVDNGKVFKVQSEVVLPLSDSHQLITRSVIRLQAKYHHSDMCKSIDARYKCSCTIKVCMGGPKELSNSKRLQEVYVCAMSERDYAFEMWRLLDLESSLINSLKLLDRIVCVKSGHYR